MKKLTVIVVVVLFNFSANAQRISYSDLKYVLYHNVDNVEDYMLQKEFCFNGIDTIGKNLESIDYSFSKNSYTSINYISVSKKSINNNFYEVSLFTVKKEDYIQLKKIARDLGYKFSVSKVDKGTLISEFIKGNLEMDFWTVPNRENNSTAYEISLLDLALMDAAFKSETQ